VNDPVGVPADADARYAWEKQMMEGKNLLPLVVVLGFAVLDSRVRNCSYSVWGDWHLAGLRLNQADAGTNADDSPAKTPPGARQ
jgi:cytochrome c-type biogenesis protein CcmH/NrfG